MAAAGLFSAPKDLLSDLISNCENAQSFLGVAGAVAAKDKIYTCEAEINEDNNPWPLIVVTYQEGDWSAERDAVGGGIADFDITKGLTVIFEKIDTSDNQETFENQLGAIVKDMALLSDPSGTYIQITGFSLSGIHYDKEKGLFVANLRVKLQ